MDRLPSSLGALSFARRLILLDKRDYTSYDGIQFVGVGLMVYLPVPSFR